MNSLRNTLTPAAVADLAARIDAALPQTQCTRCGYPDCSAYARAIAERVAPINQCPPGGAEGVARLAALTGQPVEPLSVEHGVESPRTVAWIDEGWCIGCTLCIKACPTDAIVGTHKMMHTVIEPYCTGCELCIPVCPVDCIALDNVTGHATGWEAWSPALAQQARQRYQLHRERVPLDDLDDGAPHDNPSGVSGTPTSTSTSNLSNPDAAASRQATIAAALERARSRRAQGPGS